MVEWPYKMRKRWYAYPAKNAATENVALSATFAWSLVMGSTWPPPPNPVRALKRPVTARQRSSLPVLRLAHTWTHETNEAKYRHLRSFRFVADEKEKNIGPELMGENTVPWALWGVHNRPENLYQCRRVSLGRSCRDDREERLGIRANRRAGGPQGLQHKTRLFMYSSCGANLGRTIG